MPKTSGMNPICLRTDMGSMRMSVPLRTAVPASGSRSVASIRMVVVLPAPLEPMNPKMSPGWRSNETPSTATNGPKAFLRPLTSSTDDASLRTAAFERVHREDHERDPKRQVEGCRDRKGRCRTDRNIVLEQELGHGHERVVGAQDLAKVPVDRARHARKDRSDDIEDEDRHKRRGQGSGHGLVLR